MPLTDLAIRKAKAADKPYKLHDAVGLHLYVSTAGGKLWRWRYTRAGKEQLLSLGAYPDLGLAEARAARDEARKALKAGEDPAENKRRGRTEAAQREVETFEALAREWHGRQAPGWSAHHARDVLHSLDRDVFPVLGAVPIRRVGTAQITALLQSIEARGAVETAHRLRQRISAVFVYAIGKGCAEADPAAVVKGALASVVKGRQPAITDLGRARKMLDDADRQPAFPATKLMLRLLAIVAVRPGPFIATPWSDFDELDPDLPTWLIPAGRLKLKKARKADESYDHLIPLPRQAVEILDVLRGVTGHSPFLLPHGRSAHRHASDNVLRYLLNRAGYAGHHVPHGFRSTFSTAMNERFRGDQAVIDLMLAHIPENTVEGAYNRALHLGRRRKLAQAWADLITEGLRPPADLLGMPKRVNLRPHGSSAR